VKRNVHDSGRSENSQGKTVGRSANRRAFRSVGLSHDNEAIGRAIEARFAREGGVIGWVHISVTPLLEVERRAEVNGLVVNENLRSRGAGGSLLNTAEKWARKMGCTGMSVRSNVIRDRAHAFYLRQGYEHFKTQKAFRKAL
jgi:GNAT superfamily N-acetyltransferase